MGQLPTPGLERNIRSNEMDDLGVAPFENEVSKIQQHAWKMQQTGWNWYVCSLQDTCGRSQSCLAIRGFFKNKVN